ncbi:MAG: hypothetical protein NVSMB64_27410 [Candidatus Velthaea sp.]
MKPLALVLAALFFIAAILYWTGHFYPAGVHTKHGVVMLVLAVLSLVWFRFLTSSTAGSAR